MSELTFKGKEFVYNHHLAVPHRPLVPHPEKSIGDARLDGNLIIHGDNLHALKSLLPMYAGKVDCIFIDPPYNTGNEGWCYNDNVNSPMMQEWLKSNPVGIEDGLRHDKWCAMMWPRLRLLKELLSEGGSLWITLDDNEAHRAKLMLDEIFLGRGLIANVVWQHSIQGKGYTSKFSVHHNHLLVYGNNSFQFDGLERSDEDNINYSNPDSDPKGDWRSGDVRNSLYRKNLKYPLKTPSGTFISPPDNGWRWKPETMAEKIRSGEVSFLDDDTRVMRKIYLDDQGNRAPETIWFAHELGSTRDATKELKNIFGGDSPFPTPKPVDLLARILELSTDSESIILDSFAGSGTTAHAVLEANRKDDGIRKFILVECENYADTLTAERVRRVIDGYDYQGTQREELLKKSLTFTDLKKSDKLIAKIASIENLEESRFDKIEKKIKDGELLVEGIKNVVERAEGLGGSFTYCTLGDAVEMDKMLTGKTLPSFDQLGALLFHMATNEAKPAAKKVKEVAGCGYLGESSLFHVWLIYKPELEFLKSREAALTLSRARLLAESKTDKRHLVFAPAKFVSQKLLDEEKLPVEYAPLPWALYRVERG